MWTANIDLEGCGEAARACLCVAKVISLSLRSGCHFDSTEGCGKWTRFRGHDRLRSCGPSLCVCVHSWYLLAFQAQEAVKEMMPIYGKTRSLCLSFNSAVRVVLESHRAPKTCFA